MKCMTFIGKVKKSLEKVFSRFLLGNNDYGCFQPFHKHMINMIFFLLDIQSATIKGSDVIIPNAGAFIATTGPFPMFLDS